jgi:uncharacterized protein (TIGR02452 family)
MDLIQVFEDTLKFSNKMRESVSTKHDFDDIWTFIPEPVKDNVKVLNMDSVSATVLFSKFGKTCVLNMASPTTVGGGVKEGARAQEECLFRCSNLTHVIGQEMYPLKYDECIYTKDVIFFKDFSYDYMDEVVADVVTMAAPNLNRPYQGFNYESDMKQKIALMLSLPIENGVKNIILGAWGCGVFGNDPKEVSELFWNVLVTLGYQNKFDNVVFAIINDHNSVGSNFEVFENTFKS